VKNVPTEISTRYNRLPAISAKQGKIECSLVNQSEGGFPGRCFGNALDVPNFGKIYLGTLTVEQSDFDSKTGAPKKTTITVNMIEMVMGCIGDGGLVGGGGKTNGTSQP
jgi:hypothetical protein